MKNDEDRLFRGMCPQIILSGAVYLKKHKVCAVMCRMIPNFTAEYALGISSYSSRANVNL